MMDDDETLELEVIITPLHDFGNFFQPSFSGANFRHTPQRRQNCRVGMRHMELTHHLDSGLGQQKVLPTPTNNKQTVVTTCQLPVCYSLTKLTAFGKCVTILYCELFTGNVNRVGPPSLQQLVSSKAAQPR